MALSPDSGLFNRVRERFFAPVSSKPVSMTIARSPDTTAHTK
jgi:hypothetical protein